MLAILTFFRSPLGKWAIIGFVALFLIVTVQQAFAYVNGLNTEIKTLAENNSKLETAVEIQNETINSIQFDLGIQKQINEAFQNQLEESFATVDRLRRDLRAATRKVNNLNVDTAPPEVIADAESEVNARYNSLLKCFGKEVHDECSKISSDR